jgi:predicted ATP-dependent endonuclease of OLD family
VVGEAVSMTETFITHIRVDKVRNVEDLDIPLSDSQRKHLIMTGPNGSGKTSLLEELNNIFSSSYGLHDSNFIETHRGISITLSRKIPLSNPFVDLRNDFIEIFFDAKRQTDFVVPEGVHKFDLWPSLTSNDDKSKHFLQHIVNLKAERSFARDDGDESSVQIVDEWFSRFEDCLKSLFDDENLELIFDRKNYMFSIKLINREEFSLTELPAGYSSVIRIVTEIMLLMEANGNTLYDLEGIIIIDEIETHLHVELQKKILPFLCGFFPRIQFIVSTHSPFVLSSVENAVICDLQNRIVTEDLSGYSYDALIESYFKSDKYSDILKRKVARYEALAEMPEKSDREMDEYFELKDELSNLPKYLAPELDIKLKQIALKHLS